MPLASFWIVSMWIKGSIAASPAIVQRSLIMSGVLSTIWSIGAIYSVWGACFSFTTTWVTCLFVGLTITWLERPHRPSLQYTSTFIGIFIIISSCWLIG